METSEQQKNAFIVSQHAEEAAFLWGIRSRAVSEPHFSLADLARLDARVEGHLDGLRIAGEPGWQTMIAELGRMEPGEVFEAATLAIESGDLVRVEKTLAMGCGAVEPARGAISALGWCSAPLARMNARQLLSSPVPIRRRIGLGALAVHRENPGDALTRLMVEEEPVVRSRALKAAGELGRTDILGQCVGVLEDGNEGTRFWAAWSAAILGDTDASMRVLYGFALDDGPRAERAADLLARRMPSARVLAWQHQLANDGERLRLACRVAGALGDPAAIPWLIEMMAADEIARPAGEAFSMITGVDLAFEDLERDAPDDFEAGPTEDPEDENVALDADEDLAWPDPERVEWWWSQNHSRFSPGTRYLGGQPISVPALTDVLRYGFQRQRHAAALELTRLNPGRPLFEVRARGDRQLQWLGM